MLYQPSEHGLTFIAAGWMPPATVLAGMTELGLLDDWIGAGNREDLTPPISELRDAAQRLGLVHVTFHPQQVLDLIGDSLRRHPASAEDDLRLFARTALR